MVIGFDMELQSKCPGARVPRGQPPGEGSGAGAASRRILSLLTTPDTPSPKSKQSSSLQTSQTEGAHSPVLAVLDKWIMDGL